MSSDEESDIIGATPNNPLDIAIIGGGIAGLYCALMAPKGIKVRVLEASDTVGGRIVTKQYPDHSATPEFRAEFGPMRIEPGYQPLLNELLNKCGFKSDDLVDFPPYTSPAAEKEPAFELEGDERAAKTPLDLLKLAFLRMLGRLSATRSATLSQKQKNERDALINCIKRGRDALVTALASRQVDWQGEFKAWLNSLEEYDYQNIREYAEFDYENGVSVPLWQMGFWNLMSDVLSHNGVSKLRQLGTFYHLLDENPNAAEWLVFWLRGFKTSDELKGIKSGMQSLPEAMQKLIKKERPKADEPIKTSYRVTKVSLTENKEIVQLDAAGKKSIFARHIIFAIPKSPLERILRSSPGSFSDEIAYLVESVFGFSLVKLFIIVTRRWWEEDYRANVYATRIPTRELHYWKSDKSDSKKGMIMIYTDRPGSAFWSNYLPKTGSQDEPTWDNVKATPKAEINSQFDPTNDIVSDGTITLRNAPYRLVRKIYQYIKEAGVEGIRASDIEHYGIRDWGREPYGGASHSWRPERRSWIALKKLSSFELAGTKANATAHVCGEAYSDYHGFIEGSLRSAANVMHRIGCKRKDGREWPKTETPWHCDCPACDTIERVQPSN